MNFSSDYSSTDPTILPYDDVPPPENVTLQAEGSSSRSLANRISSTKVYLVADASKSKGGKRKRDEDEDEDEVNRRDDIDMDAGDSSCRDNAILLYGTPISHLPTSNIFAYAKHFDANLLGLEWIDDKTCILVFGSKADARSAFRLLQKSLAEEPSLDDNTVTAKPIPITIWPAEHRINATLGQGEGLKGILRMRWARVEDVKKPRAREESEFYRKYGEHAGKTFEDGPPLAKKRRAGRPGMAVGHDDEAEKAKLDAELDKFLAGDDDEATSPPEPPSRMRSDYIAGDGKTLLERTSAMRAHPGGLEERLTAPLPRRARRGDDELESRHRYSEPRARGRRGSRERARERRPPRPKVTQEELDQELDAFLRQDN